MAIRLLVLVLNTLWFGAQGIMAAAPPDRIRGALVDSVQATPEQLRQLIGEGFNAVVLPLSEDSSPAEIRPAVRRIRSIGLELYYWIEVGRNSRLADDHPEWMASLQGHPEWRRYFPHLRQPASDEVVKNYPWVPVLYREAFGAQLARVVALLKNRPRARGVFLNDLQGAPSACGCGNILCRWTSDYGPIRMATPLPANAAARFATAVQQTVPGMTVIPVWTTECEKQDGAPDGSCAGVGCFGGVCWKEYTAQLMPVAKRFETLGALVPYHAFRRKSDWVPRALDSFAAMPPERGGKPIPARRLIAVLQGWDVSPEQIAGQIRDTREAGVSSYVVALTKIDQGWEPKVLKIR